MRESLNRLCSDFISNRDMLKHTFRLESSYLYPVCANILCAQHANVNSDDLKTCKKLVHEKTGVFSNFRGSLKLPVITMLAAGGDPDSMMEQALSNYNQLKKEFHGSHYLALTAFVLEGMGVRFSLPERIARGKDLYRRMKQRHWFLTSAEDCVFAVLLAFSELSDDVLIEEMEACYHLVRQKFGARNAAQSVSHVLAMTTGSPKEKTDRLFSIYDGLRAAGRKFGKYYELSTLAAVCVLSGDTESMVRDILDIDAFLSTQKGYGFWGLNRKTRLMHAAMLTADDYCSNNYSVQNCAVGQTAANSAVLTSTLAMLAAQQAAMCAVMMSSTAAVTATAAN